MLIPALWLYQWRRTGHFLPRTPLDVSILGLAVMVLVSLWATYDIAVSLPKIAGMVYGFGVYYTTARACKTSHIWLFAAGLFVASGLAIAVVSLLGSRWALKIPVLGSLSAQLPQAITGLPGAERGINPNEVAGVLLWIIPLSLILLGLVTRLSLRPPRRIVSVKSLARPTQGTAPSARLPNRLSLISLWAGLGLVVAFTLAAFVLTQSRTGYAGLALVLPLLLLAVLPKRGRFAFLLGLVVVGLLIGGYVYLQSKQDPWLTTRLWGGFVASLQSRLEIWSRGLYALGDFSFTGMGMNTFRTLVHILYPLFLVSPDTDLGHAHNEFLQAGLDLGIPGLIAFVSLNLGAAFMVYRLWRAPSKQLAGQPSLLPYRLLALGLGGGLLAHAIFGLADAVSLGARPGFLFWLLLGLLASLYRLADEQDAPTP